MFPTAVLLVAVMTVMVRARHLDGLGLSSDEAVYIGQGSSLTRGGGHEVRAHPPLFGMLLRVISDGTREVRPRLVSVLLGVVAVIVAGFIARELAGRAAGIVAALTVATMPYHSDVTRLALVEVPMASSVAVGLLLLVLARTRGRPFLVGAAGGAFGVGTLFKETATISVLAVVLAVALGLVTDDRRSVRRGAGWYLAVVASYPAYLAATGGLTRAMQYVGWQVNRGSAEGVSYADDVLPRMGWAALVLAAVGATAVVVSRQPAGLLVLLSALVPALFYALWPVASYPYLLTLVVPLGVLAGIGLVWLARLPARGAGPARALAAPTGALLMLLAPPAAMGAPPLLPGASGVPAVREAAVDLAQTPDVPIVTAAPWVANILEHYLPGRRITPLTHTGAADSGDNPAYRTGSTPRLPSQANAVVWDAWSADSDPLGTAYLLDQVRERGGRVAHVERDSRAGSPRALVVVFLLGATHA